MEKITRKEQKERTRTELLDVAEKLFSKHGILATTTADIAKAIKVSHGTVFIHFGTRDDLVLSVVERFGERLAEELKQKLSAQTELKALLKAHLSVLSEFEDFYLRLVSESHNLSPKIRSLLYSMNSAISYRLYEAAKSPMKNKEIKKMDQASLFGTWMALLQYNILNRDLFSEKIPILENNGEEILRHFLLLIKT